MMMMTTLKKTKRIMTIASRAVSQSPQPALLYAICLGCRQEFRLAQNVECNICREKRKVIFYGRNITFDCNSCKTYSNRRINCSKCNEDIWKY